MKYNEFFYEYRTRAGAKLGFYTRKTLAEAAKNGPYEVGSVILLERGVLERNNRKDLCLCRIFLLERDVLHPNKYIAFIREVRPEEDWQDSGKGLEEGGDKNSREDVDWDGLDGWLKINSDK